MAEIPIRCFAVSAVVLRPAGDRTEVLLLRRNHTLIGEWCQIGVGSGWGRNDILSVVRLNQVNGLRK